MIDFHTHTTASDGELSPSGIVSLAANSGLKMIAVTDHDTVSGIEEAVNEGNARGIRVIPGIEISTSYETVNGEIHLLGLFIDYKNKDFLKSLVNLSEYREKRNLKMIEKFKELGIDLDINIIFNNGSKNIKSAGKPDFARALTAQGFVKNDGEAFGKYLDDKTGIARVAKEHLSIIDAISLIHKASGIAVLAHPFHITKDFNELNSLVIVLSEYGLDGIEVFYNKYDKTQVKNLKRIARNSGLIKTGGSDFHYTNSYRKSKLGFYGVKKNIPLSILEDLKPYLDRNAM